MCLGVMWWCLGVSLDKVEKMCQEFPKFPFRFAYKARKVFEKQEVFLYLLTFLFTLY